MRSHRPRARPSSLCAASPSCAALIFAMTAPDIRNRTGASKEAVQDFTKSQCFCSADLEIISCVVQVFPPNFTTNRPSIAKDDGLSAPATIEHSSFDCGHQSTCH